VAELVTYFVNVRRMSHRWFPARPYRAPRSANSYMLQRSVSGFAAPETQDGRITLVMEVILDHYRPPREQRDGSNDLPTARLFMKDRANSLVGASILSSGRLRVGFVCLFIMSTILSFVYTLFPFPALVTARRNAVGSVV